MILEITKRQFANKKIRLGSEEVQIDKQGKFEVSEEKGKEYVEKYDWVFPEGKLPVTDDKGKEIDPADEESIIQLQKDVNMYKSEVENKKKENQRLKEEVKTWRNKCQELIDGKNVDINIEKVEEEDNTPAEGESGSEAGKEPDLAEELNEKSFEDLKTIYKEAGGNLQGIKTKEQVIKKLVELDSK